MFIDEHLKNDKTPTLEEVKEYFKNAKEVRCLFNGYFANISENKISEIRESFDSFWIDVYNHDGINVKLYDKTLKRYAEIISYKEENEQKSDSIVQSVINQFNDRSKRGIEKYGTTLQENNTDDFLQHLKEELMDAILYIEKLQSLRK